jgi:glycosyltransferase involved in cell wall biosynthesis
MYGWRPSVLTVDVPWAVHRDDGLSRHVPTELEVVRTSSAEARPRHPPGVRVEKREHVAVGRLRSHLGHLKRFPDAQVGWLPFAIAEGRKQRADVLYSSSGPFTSHLVGLALHRLTGKPWVAELRDGWYRWNRSIFPDYPRWRDVLEKRLEAGVIRSAQRVVLVTDRMACAFRQQYANLPPAHFAVVSNGFDPAQHGPPGYEPRKSFELVHAGALYYGRSLATFLEAAATLAKADTDFGQAFRLTLLGTLDSRAHSELARHGLGDRVRFEGQQEHAAALQAMRDADVLLLVSNTTSGAEATVPGKLFEYLASGRPVLAVAPPDSSTADVLAETQAGWLAPAHDVEAIKRTLCDAFAAHKSGKPPRADARALSRFDRRLLARDLAGILDAAHRF